MFSVHIIITYRYVFEKYYTDTHDVDEDLRTIMSYGGDCGLYWGDMESGVFLHAMYDSSTSTVDNVASKK